MLLDPIVTARLDLRVIDLPLVERLLDAPQAIDRPSVPEGWPDEDGRVHLGRWRGLLLEDGGPSPWRARTVVDRAGTLVGHAGFHGPPQPIEGALSDPTYAGAIDACVGGAVEVGYTILPSHRRRGLASETLQGLIDWAAATGLVGAIVACVAPTNEGSLAVLSHVGGFERIGRCRDGDVEEIVFRRDL